MSKETPTIHTDSDSQYLSGLTGQEKKPELKSTYTEEEKSVFEQRIAGKDVRLTVSELLQKLEAMERERKNIPKTIQSSHKFDSAVRVVRNMSRWLKTSDFSGNFEDMRSDQYERLYQSTISNFMRYRLDKLID